MKTKSAPTANLNKPQTQQLGSEDNEPTTVMHVDQLRELRDACRRDLAEISRDRVDILQFASTALDGIKANPTKDALQAEWDDANRMYLDASTDYESALAAD